jgi:ABC-2 type transport system permease protein
VFRVELFKATRRWRTWLLAAALGGIPVILVISLVLAEGPPRSSEDSPPFYALIVRNGFFAPLASLGALQVFLLPLATGLLSGDAIAGEASAGTLRYLLARPVGRLRLVTAKYASALTLVVALVAWVVLVALAAGGLAYGFGPLPTLSGAMLEAAPTLGRIALAALYVAAAMAALAAVGLFASTLTDSAPGATVATVGLAIVSQILDSLSALRAIHPYLPSHYWLAFADLFRSPIEWSGMLRGGLTDAVYIALFLAAALAVFSRKDVLA